MDFAYIGQLALVVVLALIPALIWLRLWRGKRASKQAKKYMLLAFALGSLSVFPVFLVHYIWEVFPQTDIFNMVSRAEIPVKEKVIILFTIIAVVEELAKFLVVYSIDKTTPLVRSIHSAIRFGIVAGLGFAFAENIYYFTTVGTGMPIYQFLALFSFRSLITVCGHLVFSGVFGNFYGISKFSKSYVTHEYWGNIKKMDKRALTDKELERKAFIFRRMIVVKGLIFAVVLHAMFNFFLEQGWISYVLWLIGLSLVYLIYLYRRRSGYITLLYRRSKLSHMRDKDKDVVLELLGTWFKDGKYMNVIQTCIRLLKKDPNNPVVRLFLDKAIDNQRFIDAYTAIRNLFYPKNYYEGLNDDTDNGQQKDLNNDEDMV